MTARRVHVPAALHAELTEHTSLVRVLRTARTLDLTAHLLRSDDGDETWTQWPLIDCPVPEWTLADEIMQLGETVLRHHTPRDDERGLDSDSDLDGMAPTAANLLIRHTGAVLVHILALLADQRPSAPGSMQNRLWPMNWEDVLALLAASGLVHPAIVARAEQRLECIYGPSSTHAMARIDAVAATSTRFATLAEDQLFAPPVLRPRARRSTKAAPPGRTRTRAIIDTDTDVDA